MDAKESTISLSNNPQLLEWVNTCLKTELELTDLFKLGLDLNDALAGVLAVVLGTLDISKAIKELSTLKVESVMCGARLDPNDIFWVCDTCSINEQSGMISVLCYKCFKKDLHVGHKHHFRRGGTGTCDCGDERSFSKEAFCSLHKQKANSETRDLPNPYKDRAIAVLGKIGKILYPIVEKHVLTEEGVKELIISIQLFMTLRGISELYSPYMAECLMYKEDSDCDNLMTHFSPLIIEIIDKIPGFSKFITELIKANPKLGQAYMIGYIKHYDLILPKYIGNNDLRKSTSPTLYEIPFLDPEFKAKIEEVYLPKLLEMLDFLCRKALGIDLELGTYALAALNLQTDLGLTAFKSKDIVTDIYENGMFWDKYFDVLKQLQWFNNMTFAETATFEERIPSRQSMVIGNFFYKRIFERIMNN